MQYDSELLSKILDIQESYTKTYDLYVKYEELKKDEREETIESSEKVWQKVVEVQDLINKRLEEL